MLYVESSKSFNIYMLKRKNILRHSAFWLLFICYETTFLRFTAGYYAPLLNAFIFYLLNILLFYFNAHIVLDFAFFKTRMSYAIAFVLIIVEIVTYLAIKYIIDLLLTNTQPVKPGRFALTEQYVFTNAWRGIYFIGLSIAYWSMLYMIRYKERNHVIETEQLKTVTRNLELENQVIIAQNAYLQNQVSPHLLFNTLNFIYNKIYKLSDKAGEGVMLLADLLRYSLVTGEETEMTLLSKEVEQIENLIRLSTLRNENELFIRFMRKGKIAGVRIIPLVLITLVENVVKHGDLGDPDNPAVVRLKVESGQLIFETSNKKRASTPYFRSGLGLKNIEKRLSNTYPDRYRLSVTDADVFFVSLIIYL